MQSLSPGNQPLAKEPEDSEYEIGLSSILTITTPE